MLRPLVLLGAVVVLAVSLPTVRADEDGASTESKALNRQRLIEDARGDIQRAGLGSLESAKGVVADVRAWVREIESTPGVSVPEMSARLNWLLGGDGEHEGEHADATGPGGILQAVWLGEWLAGRRSAGRYALRPSAEGDAAEGPAFFTGTEWQALDPEERSRLLSRCELDLARIRDRGDDASPQLDLRTTVAIGEGEAARVLEVDPVAALRSPPVLANGRVLVHADELEEELSEVWLAVRAEQADVHVDAWAHARPSDLTVEDTVSRYRKRVAAVEDRLDRWRLLARATGVALDRMLEQDLDAHRHLFGLENRLQAATEAPGSDDPTTEAGRKHAQLRLAKRAALLEQRMLYLTVLRAARRLELCARVEDLIRREQVVAAMVLGRFEQEERRAARDTQLSKLKQDRGWYRAVRDQARARAGDTSEPAREVWQAYVPILDDLLFVSGNLFELVELVQSLEVRVEHPTELAAPAGGGGEEPRESDPLLEPEKYVHRPRFVSRIRDAFEDPAFDAELVARTYAAASDHVDSRRHALEDVRRAEALEEGCRERQRVLEARLRDLGGQLPERIQWDLGQIEDRRRPYGTMLDRVMEAIRAEREATKRRIADLEALRRDFTRLGARSLGIREDRDLEPASLEEAESAAREHLGRAWRWLTFQGAPHLGTFLAARWAYVVLSLLVAGLLVAGVHIGRKRIDTALERLGRGVPVFGGEGVTIAEEAAEVRELRRHEQEAAAVAEATALADASPKAVTLKPGSDVPDADVEAPEAEAEGSAP